MNPVDLWEVLGPAEEFFLSLFRLQTLDLSCVGFFPNKQTHAKIIQGQFEAFILGFI